MEGSGFNRLTFVFLETASPDEDSESVCSSLDGSVYSEDGGGGGVTVVGGGGGAMGVVLDEGGEEEEQDVMFQLSEHIDQLGDKRYRIISNYLHTLLIRTPPLSRTLIN